MKLELTGTVKGKETWSKGHIFDDTKGKIPADIMILFKNKNPLVKAILDVDDASSLELSAQQIKATLEDLEKTQEENSELKVKLHKANQEVKDLKEQIKKLRIEAINKEKDIDFSLDKDKSKSKDKK